MQVMPQMLTRQSKRYNMVSCGRIRLIDHLRRDQRIQGASLSGEIWSVSRNIRSRQCGSWHQQCQTIQWPTNEMIINSWSFANTIVLTVLQSKVFPVPLGPHIRNEAMGRAGLPSPLLDRRIAFATARTASG
jgi:hypothetical protein